MYTCPFFASGADLIVALDECTPFSADKVGKKERAHRRDCSTENFHLHSFRVSPFRPGRQSGQAIQYHAPLYT